MAIQALIDFIATEIDNACVFRENNREFSARLIFSKSHH